MKQFPFLLLLLINPLHAQDAAAPNVASEELLPSQQEFLNLPEEKRTEFAKNFGEASRLFQQKRVFESLDAIEKAEKIFANSAELLNLRGSCYVEMRSFNKASAAFEQAAKIAPKNSSIRFNIAEVLFVTKQWKKAHDILQSVLKEIPESNMALARLVEFKIMLCKKRLGQNEEFVIMAGKYDYQDDSPYYYYSQAALDYEDKKTIQAEEWIARANRIFRDPNIIAPWQDTLVEYGYVESFYGDDAAPAK